MELELTIFLLLNFKIPILLSQMLMYRAGFTYTTVINKGACLSTIESFPI